LDGFCDRRRIDRLKMDFDSAGLKLSRTEEVVDEVLENLARRHDLGKNGSLLGV